MSTRRPRSSRRPSRRPSRSSRPRRTVRTLRLDEYHARLEAFEVELNRETYRQYAGLPYDEGRMEALGREIEALARGALKSLGDSLPRPLFHATIRNSRAADFTRLDNEIYRARVEQVRVEVDGEAVHLGNWRLFNRQHARDAARRRRAFDGLMERAEALEPLLAQRFGLSRELYGSYGLTPLDAYLHEEGIGFEALRDLIDGSARAARPRFEADLGRFADELLGKPPEYYDDNYVFFNLIYEPVDPAFAMLDVRALLDPVLARLGFDLSRIAIDADAREGKHTSAVCFGVQIPHEVYVLYQRTSPVADFGAYAHEMGHAVHFASVRGDLTYTDRYLIPGGVAEIFSTLIESLATDPVFLTEEVGIPPQVVRDLVRRSHFVEWFFLTFYGANAMFKLRYWTEFPTLAQADDLYADLYRQYVGVAMPGRYWRTHHVIGMYDVYAPSYLIAKVRKAELEEELRRHFGARWWRQLEAGVFLRERAMAPGRNITLDAFSRLDPRPYLGSLGLVI